MTKEEIFKKIEKVDKLLDRNQLDIYLDNLESNADIKEFDTIDGMSDKAFYTVSLMKLFGKLSITESYNLYNDFVTLLFYDDKVNYISNIKNIIEEIIIHNMNDSNVNIRCLIFEAYHKLATKYITKNM